MKFSLVVKRLANKQLKEVINHPKLKYLSKYFQKFLPQNCSLKKYIFKIAPTKNIALSKK